MLVTKMEYYQTEVYFPQEGKSDWVSMKEFKRSGDTIFITPSDKLTKEEADHNREQLEKKHPGYDFQVKEFDYSVGNN